MTDGMITIGSMAFPIRTIKEVESFKKRQTRLFLFLVILGFIVSLPFILSIYHDILHNPKTFDRNWTIVVVCVVFIIYAFVLWIVGRDLRYKGSWILNGTKTLLIESTDDADKVSALLRGLQCRLSDTLPDIGPETTPKIRWTYYVAVLIAIAASCGMFLLGMPYGEFLFIGCLWGCSRQTIRRTSQSAFS